MCGADSIYMCINCGVLTETWNKEQDRDRDGHIDEKYNVEKKNKNENHKVNKSEWKNNKTKIQRTKTCPITQYNI